MKEQSQNSYCNPLIGQSLLSLEKKDYSWFFTFSNNALISTESFWRLILDDRIVVSSDDHEQQFGLPNPVNAAENMLSKVGNRSVTTVTIHPATGDLLISFGENIQLQFLQLSSGYESWQLNINDALTICVGGGEIRHFSRS